MSRGQYAVNKKLFIVKLIIVIIFLCSIFSMLSETIYDAAWEAEYNSTDSMIRSCDEYYYGREYNRLIDFLRLYNLYEEEYDIYWEVVNAYNDFLSWHAWKGALDSGELPESVKKEEEARLKVEENAANCQFTKNQKILDGFVETIQEEINE